MVRSGMRYLYGDSVPFQLQYNFLTTLETFVTCAAQAVQRHFEIQQMLVTTADAAVARTKSQEELESFHRLVMGSLREFALRATHPVVSEYTRQVQECAVRIVEDSKRGDLHAAEREQSQIRSEVERSRMEGRTAIETFLTSGRLPVADSKVAMRLDNGFNEFSAVFTNPLKIVTSFKLTTAQVPAWSVPRKVSEFAQGLTLQVGVKKSWITRKVQPEVVQLDEFYIGGFDLSSDAAQIRLRRKPDIKDGLIFKLHRSEEAELQVEVLRPEEEPTLDGISSIIDAPDRAQLERLWQLLRSSVNDVLLYKERLLSAEIDGGDVFEGERTLVFIKRVIKMFAPIVSEISRRSPNSLELSLKHEHENGRREEIYLRKQDLVKRIEPLSPPARSLFAPFALTSEEPAGGTDIDVESH
jgi:hypothetical protein